LNYHPAYCVKIPQEGIFYIKKRKYLYANNADLIGADKMEEENIPWNRKKLFALAMSGEVAYKQIKLWKLKKEYQAFKKLMQEKFNKEEKKLSKETEKVK